MKKQNKDSKQMLFEMMEKINPELKGKFINENTPPQKEYTIKQIEFLISTIALRITKHWKENDDKLFIELYGEFMAILEKYFQNVGDDITDISTDRFPLSSYIPEQELNLLDSDSEKKYNLVVDLVDFKRRLDNPQIKDLRMMGKVDPSFKPRVNELNDFSLEDKKDLSLKFNEKITTALHKIKQLRNQSKYKVDGAVEIAEDLLSKVGMPSGFSLVSVGPYEGDGSVRVYGAADDGGNGKLINVNDMVKNVCGTKFNSIQLENFEYWFKYYV